MLCNLSLQNNDHSFLLCLVSDDWVEVQKMFLPDRDLEIIFWLVLEMSADVVWSRGFRWTNISYIASGSKIHSQYTFVALKPSWFGVSVTYVDVYCYILQAGRLGLSALPRLKGCVLIEFIPRGLTSAAINYNTL